MNSNNSSFTILYILTNCVLRILEYLMFLILLFYLKIKFQPMASVYDNSSLSLDQDTNRFFV